MRTVSALPLLGVACGTDLPTAAVESSTPAAVHSATPSVENTGRSSAPAASSHVAKSPPMTRDARPSRVVVLPREMGGSLEPPEQRSTPCEPVPSPSSSASSPRRPLDKLPRRSTLANRRPRRGVVRPSPH